MKISPAFIPHEQFHEGIWLQSVERPHWYYFMKMKNTNDITNKHFPESVDAALKELVGFLHERGIKTTPSCSGHHRSEKNFEKVYDDLEKDKEDIRNKGLQFKDVETQKIYSYRNSRYKLPWTREHFLDVVVSYQEKGVLGIRYDGAGKERILQLNIPRVKIVEKDSIIFIHTHEETTEDIAARWKLITEKIKSILK